MDVESQVYENERQRRLKNSRGVRIIIDINKQGNMTLGWNINGETQTIRIPLRALISSWYYEMRKELPDDIENKWLSSLTDEEISDLLSQPHEAPYYDNP